MTTRPDGHSDEHTALLRHVTDYIIENDLRGQVKHYLIERSVCELGMSPSEAEMFIESMLTSFETSH